MVMCAVVMHATERPSPNTQRLGLTECNLPRGSAPTQPFESETLPLLFAFALPGQVALAYARGLARFEVWSPLYSDHARIQPQKVLAYAHTARRFHVFPPPTNSDSW